MRYLIFYISFFLLLIIEYQNFAQVPERISYQAVIRDADNELIKNSEVGIRISIIQDSILSIPVYVEEHNVLSNNNGLMTLEIGNGNVYSGNFDSIQWWDGAFYIKSEIDPEGFSNYSIIGTSQLLSVPYALHAKTADYIPGVELLIDSVFKSNNILQIEVADTTVWNNKLDSVSGNESVFEGWDKNASDDFSGKYDDLTGKPSKLSNFTNDKGFIDSESDPVFENSAASKISNSHITKLNNLSGINTGDQDLSNLVTKTALSDSIANIRNDMPDTSSFLTSETDPEFAQSIAAGITQADTAAWNAASIGSYIETDPVFTAWDKSTGISITKSQITDLSFEVFEKEMTDDENNIDVGFTLLSTSSVSINGMAIHANQWNGIGTQILQLDFETRLYDKLKVIK
jgi:hypothetical protein